MILIVIFLTIVSLVQNERIQNIHDRVLVLKNCSYWSPFQGHFN